MIAVRKVLSGILIVSLMCVGNITHKSDVVNAEAETILLSDSVSIEGFQIRTNDPSSSVNFRTVCKAPNKGSRITVAGVEYEVVDMGTIYAIDIDASGDVNNSVLDEAHTLISPVDGKAWEYEGLNTYNGINFTRGYISTENGVVNDWKTEDDENTYYKITMEGLDDLMEHTLHVRAFVVARDGSGGKFIIYGSGVSHMSIPEVADYFYENSLASNYQGHKYLYEKILNRITSENPYHRSEEEEYGWNDNLFTPEMPTVTLPTSFGSGAE